MAHGTVLASECKREFESRLNPLLPQDFEFAYIARQHFSNGRHSPSGRLLRTIANRDRFRGLGRHCCGSASLSDEDHAAMLTRIRVSALLLFGVTAILLTLNVQAQQTLGGITGTVTDKTGGV